MIYLKFDTFLFNIIKITFYLISSKLKVIKKKNNIFISFKHSSHQYQVTDVLALYFESISNFVNRKINVDVRWKIFFLFYNISKQILDEKN